MMDAVYFRLRPDKEAANAIRVERLDKEKYVYKMNREKFRALDAFSVAYYATEINMEFCDFLSAPPLMITEKFQKIFQLLEPALAFKGVQLYPADLKLDQPLPAYWVPYIEETDCLHSAAQFHDIGTVRRLVLRRDAVRGKHIFKALSRVEEIWLASLAAVESILRRRPLGLHIEIVEVRE